MSDVKNAEEVQPWFEEKGPETDVVLFSQVKFQRNLADFKFVNQLNEQDSVRVKNLICDAINHFDTENVLNSVKIAELDELSCKILVERGLIKLNETMNPEATIFLCPKGNLAATVNVNSHYELLGFSSGLSLFEVYNNLNNMDRKMQDYVQVAYSNEFGYLTSDLMDCGSGMKGYVVLHLPAISMKGELLNIIKEAEKFNLSFSSFFDKKISGLNSGNLYVISNSSSLRNSENINLNDLHQFVQQVIEKERNTRKILIQEKPTICKNKFFMHLAHLKFCKLLDFYTGLDILSAIGFATDQKIIAGSKDVSILPLLYRTQEGHLSFLIKTTTIDFEEDIDNLDLKIDRLRALMFQEAFGDLDIVV